MTRYQLAYYGDDFTGSTDVMEALTMGGVSTVLFLAPPSLDELARFPDAEAVGIAGTSRSQTPAQMAQHLPNIFETLKTLDARLIHYKICSTFDSSPSLGSIGSALELARSHFPQAFTPLLVGAPILKRYVVFGNLFATAEGITYRLDRHPTMPHHPATPMTESDLRKHLAHQTDLQVALLDVLHLDRGVEVCLEHISSHPADVLLVDTLTEAHLKVLGQLLEHWQSQNIQFVVGSSGIEYALIKQQHASAHPYQPATVHPAEAIIVMSGSAAPATAVQIEAAEQAGFASIRMNAPKLLDPNQQIYEHKRLKTLACEALARQQSVLLYSARGPDDPALTTTRDALTTLGHAPNEMSQLLGSAQGKLLADLQQTTGITRLCVAGGDTCGYVAAHLGLVALELLMPIAPGSPLCLAHRQDGGTLELSLKAGQVGAPDYFLAVQRGTSQTQ
ncbi:MAG: four-carbon acid sugar kinase family protein [Deinococcota bacterium]